MLDEQCLSQRKFSLLRYHKLMRIIKRNYSKEVTKQISKSAIIDTKIIQVIIVQMYKHCKL